MTNERKNVNICQVLFKEGGKTMNLKSLINNLKLNGPALQRVLVTAGKNGKKGFSLKNTILAHKTATKISAVIAAVTIAGSVGAAQLSHNDATIPVEPPSITQDLNSGEYTGQDSSQVQGDVMGILADEYDGIDTTMSNNMKTEAQIAESLGATYKGETVKSEDGTLWVSEGDKQAAEEAGIADAPVGTEKVTYGDKTFPAKDGTLFLTQADADAWNAQLEANQKTGGETENRVVETEGNFYTAPDGSVWQNKEQYDDFLKSNNGTKEETIENGQVVGSDMQGGYQDPNGEWWTSKKEYDEYYSGLNGIINSPESGIGAGTIVNDEENIQKDQYGGYTDSEGYYHAADGYVYTDLSNYLDTLNDNQNNYNNTYEDNYYNQYTDVGGSDYEENIQKDQYGGYVGEDGYYHASNGYAYATLQDYLNDIASLQSTANYSAPAANEEASSYVVNDGNAESNVENLENTVTTGTEVGTGETEETTVVTESQQDEEKTETYEEETVETKEESTITYDEYGGYVGEDGFYHAKNGFIYVSLQDYLDEIMYGGLEETNPEKTR